MDYTQNLNLPQFAETDRIHHDDFNDAMSKIDTAVAAMPRIVTGSYTGDGTASRDINLGGAPRAVFIYPKNGRPMTTERFPYYFYSALAMADNPAVSHVNNDLHLLTLTQTGFRVYVEHDPADQYAATNFNGMVFYYIALF